MKTWSHDDAIHLSPTTARRRGPNGPKIEKEATPGLVSWPRVASKAPLHFKTPRAHHQSAFAFTYLKIMFSMGAGKPGTFQGMFAFQQRQASERCWRMVRDLLALTPCVRRRVIAVSLASHASTGVPWSRMTGERQLSCVLDPLHIIAKPHAVRTASNSKKRPPSASSPPDAVDANKRTPLHYLGHHVQDVVHDRGAQLQIEMRFHPLLRHRLRDALRVPPLELPRQQVPEPPLQ